MSPIHIEMDSKIKTVNACIFDCEYCDFKCSKRSNYEIHLTTRKHLANTTGDKKNAIFSCNVCSKQYMSRNGLWKHSKNCTKPEETIPEETVGEPKDKVIELLIKENTDFKNIVLEMVKSNGELQKQMMDMCKNSNMTINNLTNNSHSNNKTFNLMFFLNEQCKDAMNLSDFMNSFELKLEDLESIGELGYVEGITKIMVDRLNAMDIYKRPVHCSDAKRETLYVKNDDKWEKEARHNPKLRYAIKTASFQSMKLTVLWSDTYPESKSSESRLNDKYMKLVFNSTGGTGEIADSEDKIIRRILKEIVIDKS
jgi:hypothetical protein